MEVQYICSELKSVDRYKQGRITTILDEENGSGTIFYALASELPGIYKNSSPRTQFLIKRRSLTYNITTPGSTPRIKDDIISSFPVSFFEAFFKNEVALHFDADVVVPIPFSRLLYDVFYYPH